MSAASIIFLEIFVCLFFFVFFPVFYCFVLSDLKKNKNREKRNINKHPLPYPFIFHRSVIKYKFTTIMLLFFLIFQYIIVTFIVCTQISSFLSTYNGYLMFVVRLISRVKRNSTCENTAFGSNLISDNFEMLVLWFDNFICRN